MSNYCKNCRFDHKTATGDHACPITTLYWDFLDRHRNRFERNHRMGFQINNLDRKRADEALMDAIRARAGMLRARIENRQRI